MSGWQASGYSATLREFNRGGLHELGSSYSESRRAFGYPWTLSLFEESTIASYLGPRLDE
ncbi:hypothetical protein ACKRZS_007075 [Fusarium odoratissimum]